MFASARALLFGEDPESDPVSRTLGLLLRAASGGHIALDVHLFSQAGPFCFLRLCNTGRECGVRGAHLF